MYDIKVISMYALLLFGVIVLIFPEQLEKLSSKNTLVKKVIESNTIVGIVSIASSIYLYTLSLDETMSEMITVSSPLPSELGTTITSSSANSSASSSK